ncbi:MAG: peptidyl-prolyl cis-trans isomerase [Verrucomicrobia bacterium]|nr:peptidyl-prolyl cis-trans isomerase [Verrucomicrobiota bacterium]
MINVLRKYQQPLMIGITIVIIIAFGWFFTPGNRSKNAPDRKVRIYGRNYTEAELERKGLNFSIAMYAGLRDLIIGLTMGNPNGEGAGSEFLVNSFVLQHEAERLGITVDDSEVAGAIEKLPRFQTNGAYDPEKYRLFEESVLRPRGVTIARLEELVRDQVRLQKLIALLGTTVEVTPGEFRSEYVLTHQKMHTSVVRFDLAEFKAAVTPTEEEIAKVYKEREKTYTSAEKRTVSYVKLDLSEAEKALKGKELMDARQNLANRANDFGQDLLKEKASFADVAKTYKLEVKTTPEFSEAQPPADLAEIPQAAATAFKLMEKEPVSDALPMGNGYCILHLEKVTPSRQLTFEEAKPQVIEQIKAERANAALVSKGNEVQARIAADLKAGKSFAGAVSAAGLKAESLPVFSLSEPREMEQKPNAQEIVSKAVVLPEGGLSEFLPTTTGGLLVFLEKREPIDEVQYQKDAASQIAAIRERKSFMTFMGWLQTRAKFANVQGPQSPK